LRTRLFVAMAAIAVGVLLVTGAVTLGLARRGAATAARHQLRDRAPDLADELEQLGQRLRARRRQGVSGPGSGVLLASALRVSGSALVTVTPDGTLTEGLVGLGEAAAERAGDALLLPPAVSEGDLDLERLAAGKEQVGRVGDAVFLARPLTTTPRGTPVLVLAQQIDSDSETRARGFFLIGSALAAGLAMLVAFVLARRLTRPLAAMGKTADAIAAGDLSARVELERHPDDELAELAHALNAMASDLEQARGLERAFLLSVSHDLRTPLTSIRGYAEALTDGTIPASDEQRRAGTVIAAESRRLERLVTDLLDLARLDARQFSLHPRAIDATVVVGTALDAFRPAADDLGLALDLDAAAPVPLTADPDRLTQIVANLVENALKYAVTRITVGVARVDGDAVELRVQDDGPGIAPDDAPRVFERLFVSRDRAGRSVGTGLGLAIVHELAVAMGGSAAVADTGAAGACFVVRLPLAAEDLDRAPVDLHG
jgi:two-component system sensor histidine kinase BaeS